MSFWSTLKTIANPLTPVKKLSGYAQKLGGKTFGDSKTNPETERKRLLGEQSQKAGAFADASQRGIKGLNVESLAERDYLRRLASGEDSVSAEQLRQGLQQNVAAQRSLAAGASPANASMAARTAALQTGRLGSSLAGQQAVAGLQERQGAHKALSDMILGQRGQDVTAALGSRGNALTGYGAGNAGEKEKSKLEKYGPAIIAAISSIYGSDRRLKKNIEDGSADADAAIAGLRAYTYEYKNGQHGPGRHTGIMAQDLEKSGLGDSVINTPAGKAVDGGRLSSANTAMIARLGERLAKLEKGR